jgi:hypothetical protein
VQARNGVIVLLENEVRARGGGEVGFVERGEGGYGEKGMGGLPGEGEREKFGGPEGEVVGN